MATHKPDMNSLILLATGQLDAEQAARIRQAAQSDPHLAARIARVRRIVETMRTDDGVDPPLATLRRAIAIGAPRPEAVSAWWERLAQVVADLLYDSRATPALAGFRGGDDAYQLTYETPDIEVDLEVQASLGQDQPPWQILGNVGGVTPDEPADVVLLSSDSGEPVVQTQTDPRGNFRLPADSGRYQIGIRVGERAIMLRDIDMA